jgi:hypothetical protein
MDVNALTEQILREAFVLRNAVVDLKTANIKVLYLQFICFASSKLQKLTPAASSPSSSLTSSTRMK